MKISMNANYLLLLGAFLLLGCNSKTQDKALTEIRDTWGSASYSKGTSASTSTGTKTYYQVEVSNNGFFSEKSDRQGIAGGIGYMLYKNFSEQERADYTSFEVVLKDSLGNKEEMSFTPELLQVYLKKATQAEQIITHLHGLDYEYVSQRFFPDAGITADTLKNTFSAYLGTETKIDRVELYRIKKVEVTLVENEAPVEIVVVSGAVIKNGQEMPFDINLDFKKDEQNLYYINVK